MQQLGHEWYGAAMEPALEFGFAIVGDELIFRASRQAPALVHPAAREGQFQAELWRYDVAEFFLARADGSRYLEFNLSPNGAWWLEVFSGPRQLDGSASRECSVPCHADYTTSSWQAEARLPLSYLVSLGLDPRESRLVCCSILSSPTQQFLTTSEDVSGDPDFHRVTSWPLVKCL